MTSRKARRMRILSNRLRRKGVRALTAHQLDSLRRDAPCLSLCWHRLMQRYRRAHQRWFERVMNAHIAITWPTAPRITLTFANPEIVLL